MATAIWFIGIVFMIVLIVIGLVKALDNFSSDIGNMTEKEFEEWKKTLD